MNLTDSVPSLSALGPVKDPTPDEVTAVCSLLASQPDAGLLLDMILGGAA